MKHKMEQNIHIGVVAGRNKRRKTEGKSKKRKGIEWRKPKTIISWTPLFTFHIYIISIYYINTHEYKHIIYKYTHIWICQLHL